MKELKWQHVVLVGTVLMVLGVLAYLGKDGSQVLAGVLAILAALGFGYMFNKQNEIQQSTAKIEENTNGRIGQALAAMEQQRLDQIAREEQHSRAMRELSDQHRRDMKDMADKLAKMLPPEAVTPVSGLGGEGNPSNV